MTQYLAIIRTSTERQEVETQRKELLEFIKKDGVDTKQVTVIGEAGASAIKLDERYKRNLEKVYSIIDQGGVKCVYAWALDRIGRNEEVMFRFKQYLIDHQVNLKIVNPSLVLLNVDGSVNSGMEIAFSLYVTMAKQEMEQKKARFKRGKKRNYETGRFNGGTRPIFGYRVNDDGYVVPDPEESEMIVTLYELYSTGNYSYKALERELFERFGKRMRHEHIGFYLMNPTYCGKSSDIYASGRKYPAVISEELYLKCKEVAGRNKIIDKSNNIYLCSKVLKCPECGRGFGCFNDHYRCNNRAAGTCGNRVSIKTEIIEGIVWYYARLLETDMLLNTGKNDRVKYEEEIKLLETKIRNLENDDIFGKKTKNTKMLFARGFIDETEFESLMKEHNEAEDKRKDTIRGYKERIRSLKANIKALESSDEIKRLLDIQGDMRDLDDRALMRDIIRRQIKAVFVSHGTSEGKNYIIDMHAVNGGRMSLKYYPNRLSKPRLYVKAGGEWKVSDIPTLPSPCRSF